MPDKTSDGITSPTSPEASEAGPKPDSSTNDEARTPNEQDFTDAGEPSPAWDYFIRKTGAVWYGSDGPVPQNQSVSGAATNYLWACYQLWECSQVEKDDRDKAWIARYHKWRDRKRVYARELVKLVKQRQQQAQRRVRPRPADGRKPTTPADPAPETTPEVPGNAPEAPPAPVPTPPEEASQESDDSQDEQSVADTIAEDSTKRVDFDDLESPATSSATSWAPYAHKSRVTDVSVTPAGRRAEKCHEPGIIELVAQPRVFKPSRSEMDISAQIEKGTHLDAYAMPGHEWTMNPLLELWYDRVRKRIPPAKEGKSSEAED